MFGLPGLLKRVGYGSSAACPTHRCIRCPRGKIWKQTSGELTLQSRGSPSGICRRSAVGFALFGIRLTSSTTMVGVNFCRAWTTIADVLKCCRISNHLPRLPSPASWSAEDAAPGASQCVDVRKYPLIPRQECAPHKSRGLRCPMSSDRRFDWMRTLACYLRSGVQRRCRRRDKRRPSQFASHVVRGDDREQSARHSEGTAPAQSKYCRAT
jgi:hypothetical protein